MSSERYGRYEYQSPRRGKYRSPSPRYRSYHQPYDDRYGRRQSPHRRDDWDRRGQRSDRSEHRQFDVHWQDTDSHRPSGSPRRNDDVTQYISVTIEGVQVDATLDTGSDITLISEKLRNTIPTLNRWPGQQSHVIGKSATGHTIDGIGTITATISVGQNTFQTEFHIGRNITQPMIIGWDFIKRHIQEVDILQGTVTVEGEKISMLRKEKNAPVCCNLILEQPVTIPPQTQVHIQARLETPPYKVLPDSYIGLLEPRYFEEPDILIPRTLAKVEDGYTIATIVNPTDVPLRVGRNHLLGRVYATENTQGAEYTVLENSNDVEVEPDHEEGKSVPNVNLDKHNLTPHELTQVTNLLLSYSDVFSEKPGRTNLVKHTIRTGDVPPVRQRAYRTSPSMKVEVQNQIDKLLADDVIEESQSPWSSPIVMVRKKDKTYRFCVDYRKLNALTIKDSHPLPRTDDTLDSLAGSYYFSTMDLTSGYWQIAMDDADKEKTAFNTGFGLYQFKVMPMGLSNAPPTFQRLMELVLRATGAVLSQHRDGSEVVIAYASHMFTRAERRWATYDKELYAIVWAIKHFRHYLMHKSFVIFTDHKPLVGLHKIPIENDSTGRRARWALDMDMYQWEVKYRPGGRNGNADAMSRMPDLQLSAEEASIVSGQTDQNLLHINSLFKEPPPGPKTSKETQTPEQNNNTCDDAAPAASFNYDVSEMRELQRQDPDLRTVIEWKLQGERPHRDELAGATRVLRKLWWEYPKLKLIDDVLYRELLLPGRRCFQTVIPSRMVPEVLNRLHGQGYAGHLGLDKTLKKAQTVCYWPYMQRDIREHCLTCASCNSRSQPKPRHQAPLQNIRSSRPFQIVCADITELPVTPKGNRYVLVVMDHFSKYVNLYPMADQKATTVSKCLFEHYIRQHGIPEQIHTDQGRQFESDVVKNLCEALGIKKTRTTPYHPQSDGLIERFNRTLKDQIAKFLFQTDGSWDDFLGQVEFAYNTSPHATTGFSPYFLLHGRDPRIPASLISSSPQQSSTATPNTPAEYSEALQNRLRRAFQHTVEESTATQDKQKYYYDVNKRFSTYFPGDLVMLNNAAEKRLKVAPKWLGPYRVIATKSHSGKEKLVYEIEDLKNPGKTTIVHYNRLKPFYDSELKESCSPPLSSTSNDTPRDVSQNKSQTQPLHTTKPPVTSLGQPSDPHTHPRYTTRSGRVVRDVGRYGH
ncbi:hypothetical protein HOLleu_19788 [Holothuria leucospilota]|uniref:RNA-directed DNA polymerase n=1 Tax=Holothuria leucospilota TaxID=206669 RepID=A0A9Q1H582_HOLLE|nr:hypothetical protein HOLleu_19788 [Holothuria leucospilota]